ncbi:MAG: hypothetical protein HW414_1832, partial [Dehalococcoidia bacterium]|nr:hypothetical protein [Dehalococcoidia bacterium]
HRNPHTVRSGGVQPHTAAALHSGRNRSRSGSVVDGGPCPLAGAEEYEPAHAPGDVTHGHCAPHRTSRSSPLRGRHGDLLSLGFRLVRPDCSPLSVVAIHIQTEVRTGDLPPVASAGPYGECLCPHSDLPLHQAGAHALHTHFLFVAAITNSGVVPPPSQCASQPGC